MTSYNLLNSFVGGSVTPFPGMRQYKLWKLNNLLKISLLVTDIIHIF